MFKMLQRGYLLFFLDLKTNYDYKFMKEIIFLTATWLPNGQLWAIANSKHFSFLFSSMLFLFLSFFSYFQCYFLAVIKSWPLILNLCLFSFFRLFYLHQFFISFHLYRSILLYVKVQSCKLYNKHMIASTKISNSNIFAFIAILVFKLLSPEAVFIKRKDNRDC